MRRSVFLSNPSLSAIAVWKLVRSGLTVLRRSGRDLELVLTNKGCVMKGVGGRAEASSELADADQLQKQILALGPRSLAGRMIVVRLGEEMALSREVTIPSAALTRVSQILELDIERTTPFAKGDVAHGWCIDRRSDEGQTFLRHFIIRKNILQPWLEFCRKHDIDLSPSLKFTHSTDTIRVGAIDDVNRERTAGLRRFRDLAAAASVLCVLVLICVAYWRQSIATTGLSRTLELAENRAAVVRASLSRLEASSNQLATLGRQRDKNFRLSEIWEELTRSIPDSAWLSELRIEKGRIVMSGIASSSVEVLDRLESSPLLDQAGFTSAVTMAHDGAGEQFSIAVSLAARPSQRDAKQR
jgi:general secretion pathway protein L